MPSITDLEGKYSDRIAAVLCGGPSLNEQLSHAIAAKAVLIGVNEHAAVLHPFLDYVVVGDTHNTRTGVLWPDLLDIHGCRASIVSHLPTISAYDPEGCGIWDAGFTGAMATWFACYLGCRKVYILGADCYTGDRDYCWNYEGRYPRRDFLEGNAKGSGTRPLDNHLNAWRKCHEMIPRADVIRAVAPPLAGEVFPLGAMNGMKLKGL
jgi:hypothetical protein